jgi:hypothetical protein
MEHGESLLLQVRVAPTMCDAVASSPFRLQHVHAVANLSTRDRR